MAADDDDFYEDDEPLQDVVRAFQEGEKYTTAEPHQGVTLFFDAALARTGEDTLQGNPRASFVRC